MLYSYSGVTCWNKPQVSRVALFLAVPNGRLIVNDNAPYKRMITNAEYEWTFPIGSLPVRLVNGTSAHEGRLEVLYAGEWGTVCEPNFLTWREEEASVICRQLGYPEGPHYQGVTTSSYGHATGAIWVTDVGCYGTENALTECSHDGLGSGTCSSHYYDVGVMCCEYITKHC